jgi:hypothetical protein
MKKAHVIKFIAFAAVLFMTPACEDLLEEVPVSNVSGLYLDTKAGFEDAVKATYSTLRDWYGREAAFTLTVFGTDTYTMGADGSFKFVNQYTSQMDSRLTPTRDVWNFFYRAINTANAVIDRASTTIPGLDPATQKIRVAEVKFLRAHDYFLLVQMFGAVHLTLKENKEVLKVAARTPVPEIYKAIVADLESALADLPASQAQYGRVTKGACEHLLARVYLTKATSEGKAADDFAKAATYAQNVIKNYNYSLVPDFAKLWEQGGAEVNSEVIMACQYSTDPLTNIGATVGTNNVSSAIGGDASGNGNNGHLYFGMEYDTQAGMQRDVFYGRPFKRFRPTEYMLSVVFKVEDRVNDSRYKKSFRDTWLSNKPGTYTNVFDTSKKSLTFAAGDTTMFIPGFEMSLEERAKRKYQVLVPSLYKANLFPTMIKHMDQTRPDRTYEPGSRDVFMFRLAETYLIAAEALIKQNKAAEAVPFINAVRRRAAWPGKQAAMEITEAQATMDFIMEERERELAAEMFRWFDLKRWGNLVQRVRTYNPDAAPNIKDFHVLRPIPQDQIDRTTGGAASFPQNPGY